MKMQPVESSNIRSIGHDAESNTLRVEFKNGGTYEYDGVPAEVHDDLIDAPSKGQHLHKHIRGMYPAKRVD
jgi:KTSC domain